MIFFVRCCFVIVLIVRFGESKLYFLESFVFFFRSCCFCDVWWLVFIILILNRLFVFGCLGFVFGIYWFMVFFGWLFYCLLLFYLWFIYKFFNELFLLFGVYKIDNSRFLRLRFVGLKYIIYIVFCGVI